METEIATKENKADQKYIRQSFPVLEMSCAACAVSVESMLKATPGVKDASVNYANQSALVDYDDKIATPSSLQNAVRSVGYDLIISIDDPQKEKEEAQLVYYAAIKRRTIWSLALSTPVVILGMFFMDIPYGNHISMILSAQVVFYFGRSFFITAWRQAKFGKANMDTLIALSTGVAFLFSAFNTFFASYWHARGVHPHVYFEVASVVVALITLGKLLEERAKSNTSSAIKNLMTLQPKTTRVVKDGVESEVPIAEVQTTNVIIVKPGERVPVDGVVLTGSSFVDESMITGESIPAQKKQGDKVFAGTINQKGSFQFEAQKVGSDTILAHIIKIIGEAQGSKAPVQKLVDSIAGIFVPVVIGVSIATFLIWMLVGGEAAFTHALLASVTVLVIACPCALGLATPTAIMVGIGKGAENNILIRDAESLELAHKVNAIILDKTGTITEGRPFVTDAVWYTTGDGLTLHKEIVYALEVKSEHPLADAVVSHLKNENVNQGLVDSFESITAYGVKGMVHGSQYFMGNRKLLDDNNIFITSETLSKAEQLAASAKTVIYFTDHEKVLAVFGISDKIKANSTAAIATLQESGIDVYMLTGDNEQTAKAVAEQVNITKFKASMLPNDKAEFIKQLQQQGKVVAMVGDGINDAQALALADVSIAMGKGSDIAMDVAKMTLTTSDLQAIPRAITLSRKTVMTIRQNLFWAFIYNIIGIPLAAGILYPVNGFLLNPMIAGAAMALSSLSVVLNSLRLKMVALR